MVSLAVCQLSRCFCDKILGFELVKDHTYGTGNYFQTSS